MLRGALRLSPPGSASAFLLMHTVLGWFFFHFFLGFLLQWFWARVAVLKNFLVWGRRGVVGLCDHAQLRNILQQIQLPLVFKRNTRLNSLKQSWKGISLGDRANKGLITKCEVCSEGLKDQLQLSHQLCHQVQFQHHAGAGSQGVQITLSQVRAEHLSRRLAASCHSHPSDTWPQAPASFFRWASVHGRWPILLVTAVASSTVKVILDSLEQKLSCWPPWTACAVSPRASFCSRRNFWIDSKSLRSFDAMECRQHTGYFDLKPLNRWKWIFHL